MEIELRLYGGLRKYLPQKVSSGKVKLSFGDGLTVSDLIEAMKIPPEEMTSVLVNSVVVKGDEEIHHEDKVEIFPPIHGG